MCRIADYPALYSKAELLLRHEGLNSETPGFHLLKAALVVYKVEGVSEGKSEKNFFEKVKDSSSSPVPSIGHLVTKRHPVDQWITETLREQGIQVSSLTYIDDMSRKL